MDGSASALLSGSKVLLACSTVCMLVPSMGRMPDLTGRQGDVSVSFSATATLEGPLCAEKGFPLCGVQYAPHLVGSPEAAVDGDVLDVYQRAYRWLHRRDLPLISNLGADTIRLRPWNVDVYGANPHHAVQGRSDFFNAVKSSAKVRKVIPTFQLSRHYAQILQNDGDRLQPVSGKDSFFQQEFQRFSRSVADIIGTPPLELTAWSVDLSLDLDDLVDLTKKGTATCTTENEPLWNTNYQRYKNLLLFLLRWVHHDAAYGELKDVPLLLPLDISRLPRTADIQQLKGFLDCMSVWGGSGSDSSWHPPLFNQSNRWLWSFSIPMMNDPSKDYATFVKAEFIEQLQTLVRCPDTKCPAAAVVMVGTSAVVRDPNSPNMIIEDYGADDNNSRPALTYILQESVNQYRKLRLSQSSVRLDGFIVDEWQDNWDRGLQGPFVLAAEKLDAMTSPCAGSRFSHDSNECNVAIHDSMLFPEFQGLAGSTSRAGQHCVTPRFRMQLFSQGTDSDETLESAISCAVMQPAIPWVGTGLALIVAVIVAHSTYVWKRKRRTSNNGNQVRDAPLVLPLENQVDQDHVRIVEKAKKLLAKAVTEPDLRAVIEHCESKDLGEVAEEARDKMSKMVEQEVEEEIAPEQARLRDGHKIFMKSTRFMHRTSARLWLSRHLSVQCGILEQQVRSAVLDLQAVRARQRLAAGNGREPETQESGQGIIRDEWCEAMETVHKRCLQGFVVWCHHAGGEYANLARCVTRPDRPLSLLFAEALVLRTMESLGEHILNCPERLSYLLARILANEQAGTEDSNHDRKIYKIDLNAVHDGLDQMQANANPFRRAWVPTPEGRKWELGLNFDDIDECGVQCREHVTKTFKEPHSIFVFIDMIICYRSVLFVKLWVFGFSFYLYLGSDLGRDVTTSPLNNGGFFSPQWLRVDIIQYAGLVDALLWLMTEVVQLVYFTWQRGPSLGYNSPGSIGAAWLLEHLLGLLIALVGWLLIYERGRFEKKPQSCISRITDECEDPRVRDGLIGALWCTWLYWLVRLPTFIAFNRRRAPIFLVGDLQSEVRSWRFTKQDFWVLLCWLCMLAICVFFELYMLLPITRGLDWERQCGLAFLAHTSKLPGLPQEMGPCSEFWFTSSCMPCAMSIVFVWTLVMISVFLDIYFVMYIFSGIGGAVMGHYRKINDLKNTAQTINLSQDGREAQLLNMTMGPNWEVIFAKIAQSLHEESYLSPAQAKKLARAAGRELDGTAATGERGPPIELSTLPTLAAERLTFFFKSLSWVKAPHLQGEEGPIFNSAFDAITGAEFHAGSVRSLTQIIPAYNEMVIPSSDFLRQGGLVEDARNQNDSASGLGERTKPPLGDGLNSNLAFIISQFPDEWCFLAERLAERERLADRPARLPHELYGDFMLGNLGSGSGLRISSSTSDAPDAGAGTGARVLTLEEEICLWAAMRTQSVAKTVIGALQYHLALATLPGMQEYYTNLRARRPRARCPEDHVELILAHQTFGQKQGKPENDQAVKLLMDYYKDLPFYLVFDVTPDSNDYVKNLVRSFMQAQGFASDNQMTYCSCKCRWGAVDLEVLEVLPRMYPLRVGTKGCLTQGKASNQLNALRFASGDCVQAMDCNMGVFMGEAFKVPYVLRLFTPLDATSRSAVRARYIGFREFIFTGRDGCVGRCHAAAEWTFGTIYQRFLSGMATRMHYGHPDFLDGYWARNRGGMSKCSPVVNLSEDIFAGYNVRMREEASPHIDFLEFEKGREATFNAASNFFQKIAGGSVAVIRSRDNHLICEQIGLLHGLSFYFSSVAFYVSNLLIDCSIYIYVLVFLSFTLSSISLSLLQKVGSVLGTEWILSMGVVSMFPQFFELLLEFGPARAIRDIVCGLVSSTLFFIFQNKNIAYAMRVGATTGVAKYFFTGRPIANQHQSWKDIYTTYWKSHYHPAFNLAMLYSCYCVLNEDSSGRLPMVLVVISFSCWVITPVIFSPFPRWFLLQQDVTDLVNFISGTAGWRSDEVDQVLVRGDKGNFRNLYECGLADEIGYWSDTPLVVLAVFLLSRLILTCGIAVTLPAEIVDFAMLFCVFIGIQWVLVLGIFTGMVNIFLLLSIAMWIIVPICGSWVIGDRAHNPSIGARSPEYLIGFLAFLYFLGLFKRIVLFGCRVVHDIRLSRGADQKELTTTFRRAVRFSYLYFFEHQLNIVRAVLVLLVNSAVTLVLIALDSRCFGRGLHTWWLLNGNVARPLPRREGSQRGAAILKDYINDGVD